MSWKATAVRVFPTNCEWEVMRALRAGPLTVEQVRKKVTVPMSSVNAILTRCKAKNLAVLAREQGAGTRGGGAPGLWSLSGYGEALVAATLKFSVIRSKRRGA